MSKRLRLDEISSIMNKSSDNSNSDSDSELFSDNTDSDPDYCASSSDSSDYGNCHLTYESENEAEHIQHEPIIHDAQPAEPVNDHPVAVNVQALVPVPQPQPIWNEPTGNLHNFIFDKQPGINNEFIDRRTGDKPIDFYRLFLTDDLLTMLVNETNRYAFQKTIEGTLLNNVAKNSIIALWKDTNIEEMKIFLGLLLWMGLVKKPRLKSYWSQGVLYASEFPKASGMSRNRFEALLSMIHFADNELDDGNNRLYKLSPLIDMTNNLFNESFTPGDQVCIDESMVPFRGRLLFRQFIKNKRYKYGVKIFKLCSERGYTCRYRVYTGKKRSRGPITTTESIIFSLMEGYLDSGRELFTDNFYTSVDLAEKLNAKKTHLTGTLNRKRRRLPKTLLGQKLNKGELVSLQNDNKVIIGKWKDKREVLFLTTKSVPNMVPVTTKRGLEVQKPSTIINYNASKGFIDLSDQFAAYSSPRRRNIKWFRKVAFEILLNTCVVNAYLLFKKVTGNKNTDITTFREKIVIELCDNKNNPKVIANIHKLANGSRGRCTTCYNQMTNRYGRNHAVKFAKRVNTFCLGCPDKKYTCSDCFFSTHNVSVKK